MSALRGEGVPSKADIVSNLSKGGWVNLRTRGEGVKKSELLRTSLMEAPYSKSKSRANAHRKEGGGSGSRAIEVTVRLLSWRSMH